MKMRKDISIIPAKGGFVLEYMNVVYADDPLIKYGMSLEVVPTLERTTEVVPSEAKMIKRLREILLMQHAYENPPEKPQQLNEELDLSDLLKHNPNRSPEGQKHVDKLMEDKDKF